MKRTVFLAVLSFALLVFAAPGKAVTLNCGATITQNTTLDDDVVCNASASVGVYISADNVELQMNGHAIRAEGDAAGSAFGVGISTPFGAAVQGVEIRNGTIDGFATGISLAADNTSLLNLTVNATEMGIYLPKVTAAEPTVEPTLCEPYYPANNCVYRSVITIPRGSAMLVEGNNSHAWGNTVRGAPDTAILITGDKSRAVLNKVEGCAGYGISLGGYETNTVIWGNTITGTCSSAGIYEASAAGSARVRKNVVSNSSTGMFISSPNSVVSDNTASGNSYDGIEVRGTGNLIKDNTANDNGHAGFAVDLGQTNGGGNHASGNGAANCTGDETFCAGVTP